jgi:hypothetical protein
VKYRIPPTTKKANQKVDRRIEDIVRRQLRTKERQPTPTSLPHEREQR